MRSSKCKMIVLMFAFVLIHSNVHAHNVDRHFTKVAGPGLYPKDNILPFRYFYIFAYDSKNNSLTESPGYVFDIDIVGFNTKRNRYCRIGANIFDRYDGSFIVRYKLMETCVKFSIRITYRGLDVDKSPYFPHESAHIYPEECACDLKIPSIWFEENNCELLNYDGIETKLNYFGDIDMRDVREKAKSANLLVENSEGASICDYVIKDNQLYRKCYGKHVGFKMFADRMLLSLTRKLKLPDVELMVNLGDWPVVKDYTETPLPVFSWCGSNDTFDIVWPTYDLVESMLESKTSSHLDMLTVQGNVRNDWHKKIPKMFWRGRDSSKERLKFVQMASENQDLFNASITDYFFFGDEIKKSMPVQPHESFFKFFDYKYQMNLDGTVAAFRFPFLLAGGSLVFKQKSPYYEHFYHQLQEWKHYVPVERDLSDIVDKVEWAKAHDDQAREIAKNGRMFVNENLMPQHIFCYYAYSILKYYGNTNDNVDLQLDDGMELVEDGRHKCDCGSSSDRYVDEL